MSALVPGTNGNLYGTTEYGAVLALRAVAQSSAFQQVCHNAQPDARHRLGDLGRKLEGLPVRP
ncbi:hypothetical protein H7849_13880 [Alloacidobacterium dinghuense]|uniref:Uncharacterized protein n=1 Tax=Alloacidobacterium dinghuense TaxID=2763107 RepID=A0A7G8BCK3_9BACT|nr:hypothetical protein [Alloacidobacterium dinghuense]QNI30273.1 hypothetical protein H7849_13880 [Alloacidobacterium dinghuense]